MNARRAGLVAIATLAAAAGAGWSWWRSRAADRLPDGDPQALWSRRFPRPDGGELVLAEARGRPLLVNFWATWCPPCVKELPEIDRFARAHAQRLAVIGLAVDAEEPVRKFLARQPVGFAVGITGFDGTELARSLGNAAGVLPFSVLLDADGRIVQRKIGETHYAELEAWAQRL